MQPAPDLIESSQPAGSRLVDSWRALPRRNRAAARVCVAVLAALVVAAYGVDEVRTSLSARALDDQVILEAALGASSSSMSAGAGRVDFFASVLNAGPRPVLVRGVEIAAPRLRITSSTTPPLRIAPGETALVPLSVLLDCADRAADPTSGLRGTVLATAHSGRRRSVIATFGQARLVTDVADTLCQLTPGLRDVELDGPVT